MTDLAKIECWHCREAILLNDCYCRYCGRGQGKYVSWYYKHLGIILLGFFAIGPFALFFVWRSPVLGIRAKWIYTILITFMTVYLAKFMYHLYRLVESFINWFV
jgi:hypothetical protein